MLQIFILAASLQKKTIGYNISQKAYVCFIHWHILCTYIDCCKLSKIDTIGHSNFSIYLDKSDTCTLEPFQQLMLLSSSLCRVIAINDAFQSTSKTAIMLLSLLFNRRQLKSQSSIPGKRPTIKYSKKTNCLPINLGHFNIIEILHASSFSSET